MKKVFVALSGGVDSAVAAALLLREGYAVEGVFIKIWQPEFVECTWKEDRLAAMRVAVALGIPFHTLDLSDEYQNEVIENMKAEYMAGRTPNPDVLCNRFIKFGAFWEYAQAQGADYIATGHHTQVLKSGEHYELVRGVDEGKDQAYFLWQLTEADLAHTLMPVGKYEKKEIREMAERFKLPVASRPDSQGLCFVGDVDMHTFLEELLHTIPGKVLNMEGEEIGTHDGAALYTLGQRHGFHVTSTSPGRLDLPGRAASYVVATDTTANTITVSADPQVAARQEVALAQCSWVGERPQSGHYEAEVRYHQKPQSCELRHDDSGVRVIFDTPQIAASGQSLVLYSGDVCLGGGIITQSSN